MGRPSTRRGIEATLDVIEDVQPRLNAFTHVSTDEARARAAELDTIGTTGPLHGVPVAVKDLIDVRGSPTTGACAAYLGRVADHDAPVVARLRAAGAVVVAKTNLHELGAGATGLVSCFGPTRNPWDPDRLAGGSSSGSAAAVASGAVPLALGTDTGGSIRIPASFCGVTGLRPTPGRIPLDGVMPMSLDFDTVGPIARDASHCVAALAAMAIDGPHPVPPDPVKGLHVGLPDPWFTLLHEDVANVVHEAAALLHDLGAHVRQTPTPALDEDAAGFRHVWGDFADHHRGLLDTDKVSPEIAELLTIGADIPAKDAIASRRRAAQTRDEFLATLQDVDMLLVPATPYPAPRSDQDRVPVPGGDLDVHHGGPSRFTCTVNEAGLPAVSFPAGRSVNGLPVGAQLIGRPHADEHLLAVLARFQQVTSHHSLDAPPPDLGSDTAGPRIGSRDPVSPRTHGG